MFYGIVAYDLCVVDNNDNTRESPRGCRSLAV